jgi:hypothetical protein
MEEALKVLTGKTTGMATLGRTTRRMTVNIRMDLKEIVDHTRNWIDSAQNRDYWRTLVNAAMNLWVHKPWN